MILKATKSMFIQARSDEVLFMKDEEHMKKTIHSVVSLDEAFNSLICETDENEGIIGKVHSIFERVINFESRNKQMFSIMKNDLDNAPYSMRLHEQKTADFTVLDMKKDEDVVFKEDNLRIGEALSLKLTGIILWKPQKLSISFSKNNMSIFANNLTLYNEQIFLKGANGGAKYYYIKNHTSLNQCQKPSVIEKELENRICSLNINLENNCSLLEKSINAILGFGNGLTPSGDDFLAGFITALSFVQNKKAKRTIGKIKGILEERKLPTTDISVTMIKVSLEGKARESFIDFISSLFGNDDLLLKRSIDNMFGIGSSSGTDLSIGVVLGLMYSLDINVGNFKHFGKY